MSRGRLSPHQQRNQPWRSQQQRSAALIRSQHLLTGRVRQEAQQLSGPQLREMASGGDLMLPYATRQRAHQQFVENVETFLEGNLESAAHNLMTLVSPDFAKEMRARHVAQGLGVLRDADGNVIRLDHQDRPYVLVSNGEIVFVRVFKARITPKGINLDAQCTAAHPDGTREVLLVEPLPTLYAPAGPAF